MRLDGLTPPGEDDTGNGNGGNDDSSEDDETDEPDPVEPPTGDLAEVLERLEILEDCSSAILSRFVARTHEDLGMRSADEAILRRAEVVDERFQGGGPIRRTINSIWSAYRPAFLAAAWYGLTAYRRLMFNVVPTEAEIRWRMEQEEKAGLEEEPRDD